MASKYFAELYLEVFIENISDFLESSENFNFDNFSEIQEFPKKNGKVLMN